MWSLRHYGWIVVACVLALAAAPLVLAPGNPTYQADALVVARQLTVDQEALPHLAESVFGSGDVEAIVAADPTVVDGEDLIPDRLSVIAAEDSIAVVVQARDPDPATAARLANLGADALVLELNRAGAGVGEFVLQAPAILPTEPLTELPPEVRAALGALAGLVLGLGLVALLAVVRKPVVTYHDVQAAAGVPLLGTVRLPRWVKGAYAGPLAVPGITTITRWLSTVPSGRLLLVTPPTATGTSSAAWMRDRLFVMLGVALSPVRHVRLEGPTRLLDAIEHLRLEHRDTSGSGAPEDRPERSLVLVDGGSPIDLVNWAGTSTSVVAVAPMGVSQRALRDLAAEYVGGGLVGVVLVEAPPGAQRAAAAWTVRSSAADRAPAGDWRAATDLPEPERA